MVNNAHLATWTPNAKFQPDWSINESGIIKSHVCVAMTKPYPLTHEHVINSAHPSAWKPNSKFQSV